MDVRYINPFVTAAFNVIQQVAGITPERGQLSLKEAPIPGHEVAVIIGVTGTLKGQVVYSLPIETAKKLASAMMMGMEVNEFNDLARSAIGELANMISGNAAIELSMLGQRIDIAPPALVVGKNLSINLNKIPTIVVPLVLPFGTLEINVALQLEK